MAELNKNFNNHSIELDVKVNDKELNNRIEKLQNMNDLISKISIQKIENIYHNKQF